MKFELFISRNSRGKVGIEVKDVLSRTTFLELELTLEQFASVVTGMYISDVGGTVEGLQNVGKKRVREDRSVTLDFSVYEREYLVKYLLENCQEDGWTIDTYLGSKDSIKHKDNKTILSYSVYKYVEV
jgi:hypothetical protein